MALVAVREAAAVEDTWTAGTMLGPYRVLRRIAVGGMAEVFEAEHTRLGTRVALKRMLPDVAARGDGARRFVREARAIASLHHPNIVRVLDVVTEHATPHIVMEFVQGDDLRSHLDARGPLPLAEALALLGPILDAVDFAHSRGVVHRDLKPANILVSHGHDGALRPVVIDFGLARGEALQGSFLTDDDALVGTPSYFSPELCEGGSRPDARSDQYALGVIAYEALAGRRPHEGSSLASVVRSVLDHTPRALHTLRDDVPDAVDAAVMRALARDPASRFPSVRAFALALGVARNSSPPLPHARAMSWRPLQRRALGLVLLALGLAVGAFALVRRGAASGQVPAAAPATPEAPRVEAPWVEAPRVEAPRVEAPRVEAPRVEPTAVDAGAAAVDVPTVARPAPAPRTVSAPPPVPVARPAAPVAPRRRPEPGVPAVPAVVHPPSNPQGCIGPNGVNLCL